MLAEYVSDFTENRQVYKIRFKVTPCNHPTFYDEVSIEFKLYDDVTLEDIYNRGGEKLKDMYPDLFIMQIEFIDGCVYFG